MIKKIYFKKKHVIFDFVQKHEVLFLSSENTTKLFFLFGLETLSYYQKCFNWVSKA